MIIKETIEWHKIKFKTMTDELVKQFEESLGFKLTDEDKLTFDCKLPKLYETVLVETKYGIYITAFLSDDKFGVYFEDYDPCEVIAWASLPKGTKTKQ